MGNSIQQEPAADERGIPGVGASTERRGRPALAVLFAAVVLVLGGGTAYLWYTSGDSGEVAEVKPASEDEKSSVPTRTFDTTPPPPPPDAELALQEMPQGYDPNGPQPPPLQLQANSGGQQPPPPPKPVLDRSRSTMMVHEASGAATGQPTGHDAVIAAINAQTGGANAGSLGGGGSQQTGLGSMLRGTSTPASSASMLSDRNMTIAQGQLIDCVMKTRLDSTVPGMATCIVTRNLYSDNGRVVLVERGSEIVGEYSQGVHQGKARLFVLWTRLRTPHGVVISLDSPGTDALGASGLPGHVNHHFWRRFGAAMLLSVVDDTASYLANRNNNGTTVNYGGGTSEAASQLADRVLQSTINIPPTLTKNQGDRINIFVARDLYFGDVYALAGE